MSPRNISGLDLTPSTWTFARPRTEHAQDGELYHDVARCFDAAQRVRAVPATPVCFIGILAPGRSWPAHGSRSCRTGAALRAVSIATAMQGRSQCEAQGRARPVRSQGPGRAGWRVEDGGWCRTPAHPSLVAVLGREARAAARRIRGDVVAGGGRGC
jgi:hypothetical protein